MNDAERAAWLADKIVAMGDYTKEAAAMLRRWPDDGYMEAFYEMAAMLGIKGAQAKTPEQVYREQVKPALEALRQRAENAEAGYLNMREWAQQNGLDTAARNAGAGEVPRG